MIFNAKFTQKQLEALELLKDPARYKLLSGGGGSGKSFVLCYALLIRALSIPNSTHGVFRETGVSLKNSLFNDTFRSVLRLLDDGNLLKNEKLLKINSSDMEFNFHNGSKILFSGLDNAERIERLFGMEYSTVWINEVSQIKQFSPIVSTLIFRLRQNRETLSKKPANKQFWFDCNPPPKSHFIYKRFIKKVDDNNNPLKNPDDWLPISMNTIDAVDIIGQDYIDQMTENLSEREQRRMIHGEFLSDSEGSLFPAEVIEKYRHKLTDDPLKIADELSELRDNLKRVVISVDPAVTNHKASDKTGIIVAGIDDQGHCYILQDATMKGSPQSWAQKVSDLYEKWGASLVIGESNQGGDLIENNLKSAGFPNLPVKLIHARDGKLPRAQPVSTQYEKGMVHHVGTHRELEDQMESFTFDYNVTKQGSPDRLDALVHCVTELMLMRVLKPSKMVTSTGSGFFG